MTQNPKPKTKTETQNLIKNLNQKLKPKTYKPKT